MALVIPGRNRDFINAFDESLRRLNEINAAIAKNTENKRNLIDELSTLTMENETLRNNNKELSQQRYALMEEVAELRTALNNVRYYLKVSIDDSYTRLNKIDGLNATNPKDEKK